MIEADPGVRLFCREIHAVRRENPAVRNCALRAHADVMYLSAGLSLTS